MRCWWCGTTRHDTARCAGRRHDLAQALADECAPHPDDNHGQYDRRAVESWRAQAERKRAVA